MDCNEQSLRIRAYLRSPVIGDNWLPLDGILLFQMTRMKMGRRDFSLPGASGLAQPKGDEMKGGRLPIKIVHAKDWYYRCSWAQWGPFVDGEDFWSKRFDQRYADMIDFGGRRGRIDTSAGTYKGYRMPVYYRSALWVEWYCLGDREALEPLVYMTTHIGKKNDQGWGRVVNWEIESVPADWSIWKDGRLKRGVPKYHLPDGERAVKVAMYGVRPPYWDARNQMELAVP